MPVSVASQIFSRSCIVSFSIAARSPDSHGLERLDLRQFRLRLDQRRDALQAIHHLRIHRMLDPQRAVLIERGDALLGRHELRAGLLGRGLDEFHDGLLGRAVVPRSQRSVRSLASPQPPGRDSAANMANATNASNAEKRAIE